MYTPKSGTKRYFLASLCAEGKSTSEAFAILRPLVMAQTKPWIFSANVPGIGRQAKPLSEQLVELQHEISRVWNYIARDGNAVPAGEFTPDEIPAPDAPMPDEKPRAKVKSRDDEKAWFVSEWERIMNWIRTTSETQGTNPVDSLETMRPIQAARACIDSGISARTLLHAMTLHWPKATRENAGIAEVDFTSESEDLGEGFHSEAGYVLKLANASRECSRIYGGGGGFGIALIGPAGTGKSRLAKQVASLLSSDAHPDGLPYGETPLTPGATRGDLLGRITIEGYITSQFVEIYSGGGIFNFEEMDAADPSMLIVVNNALASDRLFNSVNGEVYHRHPDFIPFATMNTFGMGADAKYTGREKLDLASIDRFRMGRVPLNLDMKLAKHLMFGEIS